MRPPKDQSEVGRFYEDISRFINNWKIMTATGTVETDVQFLELSHATVVIAATIPAASKHHGFFLVKNTSSGGTAAHTVTLTAGTWDGTNDVATLNAPDELLLVYFDSAGKGTIIHNEGAVALS